MDVERNITALLENISRNMGRFSNLPTPKDLMSMKEDLEFKEDEMKKSEMTTIELAAQRDKLQQDLAKMDQFEEKLREEQVVLQQKISDMEKELAVYSDLEKLRADAEEKKKKLMDDRIILQRRRENFKKRMQQLTMKYEGLKSQLNENETYAQLSNLEKKWQHHEQNNFSMKEFISARTMECDYTPLSRRVYTSLEDFNSKLQSQMLGKTSY